jgi:hypothetical protein
MEPANPSIGDSGLSLSRTLDGGGRLTQKRQQFPFFTVA